jgi:hypothetical protein
LKVPRQCPLILLVEVHLSEGKALGKEKGLGSGLFYEERKEVERGLTLRMVGSKLEVHSVPTSQKTHYVSATKPNRLMLFGETVAVYCENHTEHTDTLFGQNAEFWCVKAGGIYSYHWAVRVKVLDGGLVGDDIVHYSSSSETRRPQFLSAAY